MLYAAYQAHSDIMGPVRAWAGSGDSGLRPINGFGCRPRRVRNLTAAYELIARAGLTHARPPFGIDSVTAGNREVAVREEAAHVTPFGTLLHFKKDIDDRAAARAAGRAAVGAFRDAAAQHRAHHAARARRLHHRLAQRARRRRAAGRFGFDEYVEHLIKFLEVIGPGAHVVAVCQPCVAALVAAAVMAQSQQPGAAASA